MIHRHSEVRACFREMIYKLRPPSFSFIISHSFIIVFSLHDLYDTLRVLSIDWKVVGKSSNRKRTSDRKQSYVLPDWLLFPCLALRRQTLVHALIFNEHHYAKICPQNTSRPKTSNSAFAVDVFPISPSPKISLSLWNNNVNNNNNTEVNMLRARCLRHGPHRFPVPTCTTLISFDVRVKCVNSTCVDVFRLLHAVWSPWPHGDCTSSTRNVCASNVK